MPLHVCVVLRRSGTDSGRQEGRGRKIALDIARGLAFLHQMQLIHFDVKSPNGTHLLQFVFVFMLFPS